MSKMQVIPSHVAPCEQQQAATIAALGQELIQTNPSLARGLIHALAEALPSPMRPTRWPGGRKTESPAAFLRSEVIEDVTNWADLASEYELMVAATAAVQRMRKGTRQRFIREVARDE